MHVPRYRGQLALALILPALLSACSSANSTPTAPSTSSAPSSAEAPARERDVAYIDALKSSFARAQCQDTGSSYACMFTTKGVVVGYFPTQILVGTFHAGYRNLRIGTGGNFLGTADGASFVDALLKGAGIDDSGAVTDTVADWYKSLSKTAQTTKATHQAIWSGAGNGVKYVAQYPTPTGRIAVVVKCFVGLLINADTNCEVDIQKN